MRTKKLIFLAILLLCLTPLFSKLRTSAFLDTAINIAAGGTGTFTSNVLDVMWRTTDGRQVGGITVTFTRAAGAADTVDFTFDISYDGGTTWASFEGVTIQIATNHAVISGTTVRAYIEVNLYGISHIKLHSIKNNDGVNNITACNATLSI